MLEMLSSWTVRDDMMWEGRGLGSYQLRGLIFGKNFNMAVVHVGHTLTSL